jgi:hypothetical protein
MCQRPVAPEAHPIERRRALWCGAAAALHDQRGNKSKEENCNTPVAIIVVTVQLH